MTLLFLRPAVFATALFVLGSTACGGSDSAPPPTEPVIEAPKLTSRRLVTSGGALVDELGRKVILRGINVGGRSKMPPFVPFDIMSSAEVPAKAERLMAAVKKLGANGVRLTLSWEALEPTRGTYDNDYIGRYRALLDAADKAGLAVIIDFHQDVFQAAFCGDGFPDWTLGDIAHGAPHYDCNSLAWSFPYFDPMSDVSRAFDGLWNNRDGVLDAFVAMWSEVAREVGRHPAVAAFEVMNEPGSGSVTAENAGMTILPAVYDRVAAVIETEAGSAAVLGDEPIAVSSDWRLTRPQFARFTYAPHYYDPATTLGNVVDQDRIRSEVSTVLARAESWGVPVVLGEFGAPNSTAYQTDFATAVLDASDVHRASAIAWEASTSDVWWNNENFSAFTSDGSEQPWAAALDRPVARAIDGTIVDLTWDAVAARFALAVRGEGGKVSEVYLPSRRLGTTPKITVTGARFRWMPDEHVALVVAAPNAAWTLVAEAEAPPAR